MCHYNEGIYPQFFMKYTKHHLDQDYTLGSETNVQSDGKNILGSSLKNINFIGPALKIVKGKKNTADVSLNLGVQTSQTTT